MATLAKTFHHEHSVKSMNLTERYNQFTESLKFSYYGIITMTMTIGSCLGAIATMYVFENNAALWQFVLALTISMANNVAAISQASIKWVVNLFILNVVLNSLIILVNVV
jgi:hypothetical protein